MSIYNKLMYRLLGGTRHARRLGVEVGPDCRILTHRFGSEPWLIKIGERVTVSSDVAFINHDGIGWLYRDENGRRYRYAKISIGDDVFIGANAIIMPGVKIGSCCVVGAGSVVTKSIPDGSVVAGNPARFICHYSDLMSRVSKWPSQKAPHSDGDYRAFVSARLGLDFKPPLQCNRE